MFIRHGPEKRRRCCGSGGQERRGATHTKNEVLVPIVLSDLMKAFVGGNFITNQNILTIGPRRLRHLLLRTLDLHIGSQHLVLVVRSSPSSTFRLKHIIRRNTNAEIILL